jgi:hypothetical protein
MVNRHPFVLRERAMNLNGDQDHDMPSAPIHKPEPFILEKNGTFQIKLVLLSVVIVAVVWVGVLITLAMEVVRRIYG